jgi:hypothetical protein
MITMTVRGTPGGFENCDAGNSSALTAAASHAGVDRNHRRTRPRGRRAGPSESRTLAQRGDLANCSYIRLLLRLERALSVDGGDGAASPLDSERVWTRHAGARHGHRCVDALLQSRKIDQGHGAYGRGHGNLNRLDAPLGTRTMSHNVWGFVVKKTYVHDKRSLVPDHLLETRRTARGRSWKMKKHRMRCVAP